MIVTVSVVALGSIATTWQCVPSHAVEWVCSPLTLAGLYTVHPERHNRRAIATPDFGVIAVTLVTEV